MDKGDRNDSWGTRVSVPFWLGCSLMDEGTYGFSKSDAGFSALLVGLFIDGLVY